MSNLPSYFVTALEMSAKAHQQMVATVAPFIDTSISKTVNVPENYPYAEFQDLYLDAWKSGLKGLATYRPNKVLGSVLSVQKTEDFVQDDVNRRIQVKSVPAPVLASLRWPGRPDLSGGNPAWTYMIEHPQYRFAVFVGHVENGSAAPDAARHGGGRSHAFEVWVNGSEQPRGLGALAKTLSMDMRADDSAWLKLKLDTLAKAGGDEPFEMPFPPRGEKKLMPSVVSAFAQIVRWRVEQLQSGMEGDFSLSAEEASSPVLDAMFALKEPKTGTDGTMSWTVDVLNPRTGDDFVLGLKEITLPDGITRPYSVWLSGEYPRALDGLCKILSLDMRVLDPAWVGMKLKKLLEFPEPLGDFMAFVPGSRKQQTFPSTMSYLARLILHRYAMLGILDDVGSARQQMGILESPLEKRPAMIAGARCPECANPTLIRKDGCDYCTACGYVGVCG
jgi:ribonucleoside-diphosphate reductase alpha chain